MTLRLALEAVLLSDVVLYCTSVAQDNGGKTLSYGPPYAGKLNRSTNLAFLTVFQNLHQHDDIVSRCCDYFNCPLPLTKLI